MLHANLTLSGTAAPVDRRHAERLHCYADLVLAWNHDLEHHVRFGVCDISEDGMKIISSEPILRDLTGIAIALLPERIALNKIVRVVWVQRTDRNRYVAGLRFLS